MSVGGRIIEIAPVNIKGRSLVRLWCIDPTYGDEVAVCVEPFSNGPQIGDRVWWQQRKVYFDHDRRWLTKVGNSFDPRPDTKEGAGQ